LFLVRYDKRNKGRENEKVSSEAERKKKGDKNIASEKDSDL